MTDIRPNKIDAKGIKILFVSYFYPPASSGNVPGAMRTIKFIRNMTNGEFHVLTTQPDIRDEESALRHIVLPVNHERIYRVNYKDTFKKILNIRASIKNLRISEIEKNKKSIFSSSQAIPQRASQSKKIKDLIYDLFYHPDQYSPWIRPAYRKGCEISNTKNIDLIFSTGSPWSALYTAYKISKSTGKPLIVDFRDPWTNNPFHHKKGSLLQSLASRMERKIIRYASAVTLNTEPLREDFLRRYHDINADKFFVLPNGYDDSDASEIKQTTCTNKNTLELCHTGLLYGIRDPRNLLIAIRQANKKLENENIKIRLKQIGGINLSYSPEKEFEDLITNESLEILNPKPYLDCIQDLYNSDILINIQPFTKTQVPSKFYDYLMTNKPIINLTPRGSALDFISQKNSIGTNIDPDDIKEIERYLIEVAKKKGQFKTFSGYPNREEFSITRITSSLLEIIENCTE